jgi:molybdenum cofactor cytidylyltransferase
MTALIILAAGASNRLGQPKQNLLFENKTLLQRAIDTGLASNCKPVIVVLGANAGLVHLPAHHENLKIMINPNWGEGMASSIRVGLSHIEENSTVSSVIIMLCDQPFVSPELIESLQQRRIESGKPLVACFYQDTAGVPALFDRSLFGDLLSLSGSEGAKKIIKNYADNLSVIPFEKGEKDIDTLDDYERLLKRN